MDVNPRRQHLGNGGLPFDVLGPIFEHYLKGESRFYPLECLMLVCKAWNEAALGHPSLWGTYRIVLEDEADAKHWLRRLPLRLRRAGPQAPLHIDISCPAYKDADDQRRASALLQSYSLFVKIVITNLPLLLNTLAGENGIFVARWKSLRLEVTHPYNIETKDCLRPFKLPMPSLISLHLTLSCAKSRSSQKATYLTDLPAIKSITLKGLRMNNLPDMSLARQVTVEGQLALIDSTPPLLFCPRVEALSLINSDLSIEFCERYSFLRTLRIQGSEFTRDLAKVSMSRLETLIIHFAWFGILDQAADLQDIGRVTTLHLFGENSTRLPVDLQDDRQAASNLLHVCASLNTLRVDEYALVLLLREWSHLLEPASIVQVFLVDPSTGHEQLMSDDTNFMLKLEDLMKRYHYAFLQ